MNLHYLSIAGTDYPACFSMAATEDIINAFGGMDKMSEGLIEHDISTVGTMLSILIKAGCEYCDLMGEEHPKIPNGRLTALLSVKETADIVDKIMTVMTDDAERTVEVRSKN